MIRSSSPIHRNGSTTLREFYIAPASFELTSNSTARTRTMQDLQRSNVPPFDHTAFSLPEKSVNQVNSFVSSSGKIVRCETETDARKVNREEVQDFFLSGAFSKEPSEVRALKIFLLTNKLYGALAWLVVRSNPGWLELADCALGNEIAGKVVEWVKAIPFKVKLDLSDNGIDAAGAALLAEALEADTITHLDLSGNPLGAEGVQLVCAALVRNKSLRSLSLAGVGAASLGFHAIASVLDSHPSLSSLNLNVNAFDDDAAAGFAAALGHNTILTDLSLIHVEASDAALCSVAGALMTNTALDRISLSRRKPDDLPVSVAETLCQALMVNQTLTCLQLPAASVTGAAANRLAMGVAQNTTLRFFFSRFLYIPGAAAVQRHIDDKLRANALIDAAGDALSDLSKLPEATVPIPSEAGRSIAAFVAQVATDENRRAAIQSIVLAGPLGLQIPFA